MIENLLLLAISLMPYAVAFLLAVIVVSFLEKSIKKKQRAQRKAEHKAQADADMAEMQKVYCEVLFNRIMKGN